jgi:hypothetical protein
MVPDKLCKIPTLMVSAANTAGAKERPPAAIATIAASVFRLVRRFIIVFLSKEF